MGTLHSSAFCNSWDFGLLLGYSLSLMTICQGHYLDWWKVLVLQPMSQVSGPFKG